MRLRVEQAAMELATRYYRKPGCYVTPVADEHLGWDLEVSANGVFLRVEVKGNSGPDLTFELTPNEYEKMRQHRDTYRIFAVTEALRAKSGAEFLWKAGSIAWLDSRGRRLRLRERIGASVSLV